jgi:transposase-like protein
MARQRTYSIEFKKQVVQDYLGGATLHGLAKRHGISRNLIRVWLAKYEAGEYSDEAALVVSLEEYEARIAMLERKVGQLTLENDLLKKTLPVSGLSNGGRGSIVSGPALVSGRRRDVDS